MAGQRLLVRQMAGKQPLTMVVVVTGKSQHEALVPQRGLVLAQVPMAGFVQKHGMLAGMAKPSRSSQRQLIPFWHCLPLRVHGLPMPISLPVLGGQPAGTSGTRKSSTASLAEPSLACPASLPWHAASAKAQNKNERYEQSRNNWLQR
jgi:hypothetical protein